MRGKHSRKTPPLAWTPSLVRRAFARKTKSRSTCSCVTQLSCGSHFPCSTHFLARNLLLAEHPLPRGKPAHAETPSQNTLWSCRKPLPHRDPSRVSALSFTENPTRGRPLSCTVTSSRLGLARSPYLVEKGLTRKGIANHLPLERRYIWELIV